MSQDGGKAQTAVILVGHGGVHSEVEIPATLDRLHGRDPAVTWQYAWPVDFNLVARILADQLRRLHPTS